ncbi:MAG TPA: AbrB family transcriptional regulator [Synergistales bacterium]|nr:AbrB family transcriptional regulator [Synergistales bacterium]
MSISMTYFLIILLGCLGYMLFDIFNIPGSAITGSLTIVALFSSFGVEWAILPPFTSTFFQIIIGITIGCRFGKENLPRMKRLVLPGLVVSVWMLLTGLVCGILLTILTDLELGTALYSSVPGGMAEMGLIALSRDLSVPMVSMFQFVRVVVVQAAVPIIAIKYKSVRAVNSISSINFEKTEEKKQVDGNWIRVLATFLIGSLGGLTAKNMGVPVGGMLGSMIVVGILRTWGLSLQGFPKWAVIIAQIGIGSYLGMTFSPETASNLHLMFLPTIGFSILLVISGIALGFVARRVFGWDLTTSLLACSAAGVTQMSSIALDMKADAVTVGLIHSIRLALIVLVMPMIINCFL